MAGTTVEQLSAVPLLAGVPADKLAVLASRFEVEEYEAGHVIVEQGRHGYAFYVLAEGRVAVLRDHALLRELVPGDFFGEIAILGQDGRRTASVTATTDATAWVLFGTEFRALQMSEPAVAAALEQAMRDALATD